MYINMHPLFSKLHRFLTLVKANFVKFQENTNIYEIKCIQHEKIFYGVSNKNWFHIVDVDYILDQTLQSMTFTEAKTQCNLEKMEYVSA